MWGVVLKCACVVIITTSTITATTDNIIILKVPPIPDICQFWYTTSLFRPETVHQKLRKFATKFRVLYA